MTLKKFWVIFFSILVACVVGISMIFVFSTRETIKISANVMYVNVGDEFKLNLEQTNADNSTTISAASSDASIVSFDNGLCVAKTGGVARITFTTSNARFRNLYCDVMVGDGSMENPYYISTAEQLASIGQADSPYTIYSCYKLVNDIDMSKLNDGYWTPIAEFAGRLDGNGYTISNMVIVNNPYEEAEDVVTIENAGVFGKITEAGAVYNLKIDNFYATGSYSAMGTLAGINNGIIERVEVKNTFLDVKANFLGGVVGRNMTIDNANDVVATISKTSANVVIGQTRKDTDNGITVVNNGVTGIVGGIAGQNLGGTISNTYTVGKVVLGESGIMYGGLVGDNQFSITSVADSSTNSYTLPARVENSYSAIALFSSKVNNFSSEIIGGVIGQNTDILEEVDASGVVINLNSNNLCGLYYDYNKLRQSETTYTPDFKGVGNNLLNDETAVENKLDEKSGYVMGYNNSGMKKVSNFKSNNKVTEIYNTEGVLISTRSETTTWDFENVWQLSDSVNNGYPYLTYIYTENTEEDNSYHNYMILETNKLTISQGNIENGKSVSGISSITITDSEGNKVDSTAGSFNINVVDGFRITTNSKGAVIYDLDNKVYYTITYTLINTTYKFNSIELDEFTKVNGGTLDGGAELNIWFRNANHTLTIIDSKTDKKIYTATIAEDTSLKEIIVAVQEEYDAYKIVRLNTSANGTGSTYSTSSRMPKSDLTLYVIYNNTTGSTSKPDLDVDINDPEKCKYCGEEDCDGECRECKYCGSIKCDGKCIYCDNCGKKNCDGSCEKCKYCGSKNCDGECIYCDNCGKKNCDGECMYCDECGKKNCNGECMEEDDCYEIASVEDWNKYVVEFGDNEDVRFVQVKDFTITTAFEACDLLAGQYDGNNYTIKVKGTLRNFALFNEIANTASINNLDVTYSSATFNSVYNDNYFGGIVNVCKGTIDDCTVSGSIDTQNNVYIGVAGIVGHLYEGAVIDCVNSANVSAEAQLVAGIVASMRKGNITDCSNSKAITNDSESLSDYEELEYGTVQAAGIVAYMYGNNNKTVETNSNSGKITTFVAGCNDGSNAGGIVAYIVSGEVIGNENTGKIVSAYQAGGIVAYSYKGTITANTNSADIVANTNVLKSNTAAGGIVGKVSGGTVTKNVHTSGTISACSRKEHSTEAYAGGIIGCMFYGGSASNNKLSKAVNISATGVHAFASGGCGRVCKASFKSVTTPSGWQNSYTRYVSANGTFTYITYDANIKN